ncbi:Cell division protein FtsB [Candidatus Hartigia pinicola]|nr:Cell division protein FtsB [Candidatus Hartigia pinicola]
MGKLTILLIGVLAWMQYSLWLGKNGIYEYICVNNDISAQEIVNARLKVRNEKLFSKINDLNNGQEAIEEHIRNELGMVKPGESFYRIVKGNSKKT